MTGPRRPSPRTAYQVAVTLLAARSRSRSEVEEKLREKGFPFSEVAGVVSRLTDQGYLDDERFARGWAASRVARQAIGAYRLHHELVARGVDAGVVARTIADVYATRDERDVAYSAAQKKWRTLRGLSREVKRRRLAGHLARRGFPADVIASVLRRLDSPSSLEDRP